MTTWEQGPVRWLNRHAVIQLPATVDQSSAELVRQQLHAVLTRDLLVLIVDLSGTTDCDHACGEALAQAYQRAMITGTDLRLVVGPGAVPRLLRITGLDRVVPVYVSMAAAIDATRPADTPPPPPADAAAAGRAQRAGAADGDLGLATSESRSRCWTGTGSSSGSTTPGKRSRRPTAATRTGPAPASPTWTSVRPHRTIRAPRRSMRPSGGPWPETCRAR
jgi:anti-sigma B factor antagonist